MSMLSTKTLISVAIAAAFAFPLSGIAAGDKMSDKKASGTESTAAAKSDGGTEAMFSSLDKNKDGNLSKEEVKGTPHEKDFSSLDKDNDGKLTREEHAAAPEHQKGSTASSASGGAPTASGKK
jgi:Ca2+-binding EF-hand superfamily protein